jgi:hypothetical protein
VRFSRKQDIGWESQQRRLRASFFPTGLPWQAGFRTPEMHSLPLLRSRSTTMEDVFLWRGHRLCVQQLVNTRHFLELLQVSFIRNFFRKETVSETRQ